MSPKSKQEGKVWDAGIIGVSTGGSAPTPERARSKNGRRISSIATAVLNLEGGREGGEGKREE